MKTNLYDNPKETEDFDREMAISADPEMKHPNIVKVYGLVKEGDGYNSSMHVDKQCIVGKKSCMHQNCSVRSDRLRTSDSKPRAYTKFTTYIM